MPRSPAAQQLIHDVQFVKMIGVDKQEYKDSLEKSYWKMLGEMVEHEKLKRSIAMTMNLVDEIWATDEGITLH